MQGDRYVGVSKKKLKDFFPVRVQCEHMSWRNIIIYYHYFLPSFIIKLYDSDWMKVLKSKPDTIWLYNGYNEITSIDIYLAKSSPGIIDMTCVDSQ